MTRAEVRQLRQALPWSLGLVMLPFGTRIALLAVEEQIDLWVAGVLIAGGIAIVSWAAIVVRRRCRRRLAQLDELPREADGGLEMRRSVPRSLWVPLIAIATISAVALWQASRAPGFGNTCVSKGIATVAAREGICQRGASLLSGGITYNVVDAGDVLHMPGFDARLLGIASRATPVADASPALYPDGMGTLICIQLAVTNRRDRPMRYDAGGSDVGLLLQGTDADFRELTDDDVAPGPALDAVPPIAPGDTTDAWVTYVVPESAARTLNVRASDLELRLPSRRDIDVAGPDYVGQIRLWKAATAQGEQTLVDRPLG